MAISYKDTTLLYCINLTTETETKSLYTVSGEKVPLYFRL